MESNKMIYEGIKKRIQEYIESAKEDAKYNWNNGWDVDAMIEDADETHLELVREIEKMAFFLGNDEETVDELVEIAHEAFDEVEDFILTTYDEEA